tara:strand:+ start:501 stop:602 length:102 start_codon:yes stop_codon:yes gene_type:complete
MERSNHGYFLHYRLTSVANNDDTFSLLGEGDFQ